jgi:hypothetical protein
MVVSDQSIGAAHTSVEFTLLRSAGDEYLFAGEQGNQDDLTNNKHRINFMDKAILGTATYNTHELLLNRRTRFSRCRTVTEIENASFSSLKHTTFCCGSIELPVEFPFWTAESTETSCRQFLLLQSCERNHQPLFQLGE